MRSRSIAPAASGCGREQRGAVAIPAGVPTLKENGIDLVADAWYGMWLPAGSSPEFAKQLSEAVATALAKPEVQKNCWRSA